MIVKINIGGVWVSFGYPSSEEKPEPFYPHLISVDRIQEDTGAESGSANFILALRSKELLGIVMRREVKIYNRELELQFEGLLSKLIYTDVLTATVEA